MTTIDQIITGFIQKLVDQTLIKAMDKTYITNRLLHLLNLDDYRADDQINADYHLLELTDKLIHYAIEHEIIAETHTEIEQMEAAITDLFTPRPSAVNENFWDSYQDNPMAATDAFYQLSRANDYIKTRQIEKNIHFMADSSYGDLEVTINLSKPEKDPKEIAKAQAMPQVNYPKCALCFENEGYQGHANHAARQNHRIIRFPLGEETFGFQYSPYAYYSEHSIFINADHQPMTIDRRTFHNLLEIIDVFPHYFAGSNADLPIVGGSILSHDHYQGGRQIFPIDRAETLSKINIDGYQEVDVEILAWPMSVIRLKGTQIDPLVNAAALILDKWISYSNEDCDIRSHTGDERHNTVTPIARKVDDDYQLDLVLRNNRTSAEHPEGIFHPHQDVQHIKKENIGLIEVMGLAIFPPRLLEELGDVKKYLLNQIERDEVPAVHRNWAEHLARKHQVESETQASDIIQAGLGQKYERILEDAGVFKQTPEGQAGFMDFIEFVNNKK